MILGELESATSDRVTHWPRYVDEKDYRYGPGWGPVMAAFCYPSEGRFNTLARGAYYAGDSLETALQEWVYHTVRIWQQFDVTNDFSAVVCCYAGHTCEPLVDLRAQPQYMHDTHYAPGQQLAADLLNAGEHGIVFSSLRNPGAEAIALLRPPATTPVVQAGHYVVQWDGNRFTHYARIEEYSPL